MNPSTSSGYGISQTGDQQAIALGFEVGDQDNADNSVVMMGYKLALVMYALEDKFHDNLDPTDYLIAAACCKRQNWVCTTTSPVKQPLIFTN